MFALVIKEKVGVVGGWLEVGGEEHTVPFGDDEDQVDRAIETQAIWSDWMEREVDSVQTISNGQGVSVDLRPCLVDSIALVYVRS